MTSKLTLQTRSSYKASPVYDHGDDSDSDSGLPFPEPLPRTAFLDPSFTPQALLSTLTSRHQTLSDLRAELSSRSQTIASELLTLVNNEYQAFLGLGQDLKGGEEKVEELKMGVLGLVKGVQGVKEGIRQRETQVEALLKERQDLARQIGHGRALLRVSDQIGELEEYLSLAKDAHVQHGWSDEEEESETDEEDVASSMISYSRLKRLVHLFVGTRNQVERLGGTSQAFLAKQGERMAQIQQTLLLDLGTALKEAKNLKANTRLIRIMELYTDMDEGNEALKVIREYSKP